MTPMPAADKMHSVDDARELGQIIAETLPMQSVNNNGTVVATSVTNKFEYDARGNRTKKIEAFGLAEVRTTLYFYDKADRLIETRGERQQQALGDDAHPRPNGPQRPA